jgi:hypothetical protein
MFLKPGLQLAKRVFDLSHIKLSPDLYTNFRNSRRSQVEDNEGTLESRSFTTVGEISEAEIWGLFFNDVCRLGVSLCQGVPPQLVEKGGTEIEDGTPWIDQEEVEVQEPYLFIGLPACALFNKIFLSFRDKDAVILSDGRRIVAENCPSTFKALFEMLLLTKSMLNDLVQQNGDHLEPRDVLWMQQFLLYSSSPREIFLSDIPSAEQRQQYRQALSHLVGVSIELTQLPHFKDNFMTVLDDIADRSTSKEVT